MMRRGNRHDVVVVAARERMLPLAMRIVEQRLQQWSSEYRDHPTRAWTILGKLIDHAGFVPDARGYAPTPINTLADEIEAIVQGMSKIGMHKVALVLRCEYFDRHSPDVARLEHLRALGVSVSRTGYYDALNVGRAYIAGKLHLDRPDQKA